MNQTVVLHKLSPNMTVIPKLVDSDNIRHGGLVERSPPNPPRGTHSNGIQPPERAFDTTSPRNPDECAKTTVIQHNIQESLLVIMCVSSTTSIQGIPAVAGEHAAHLPQLAVQQH